MTPSFPAPWIGCLGRSLSHLLVSSNGSAAANAVVLEFIARAFPFGHYGNAAMAGVFSCLPMATRTDSQRTVLKNGALAVGLICRATPRTGVKLPAKTLIRILPSIA
ncbi:hypothetical protein NXC24_PB00032 (plasmid) [Rhizobium sp. NXC24]|nr:hypothetical protein NXC24_PB00032 [Rhizobium sp. NXC24]